MTTPFLISYVPAEPAYPGHSIVPVAFTTERHDGNSYTAVRTPDAVGLLFSANAYLSSNVNLASRGYCLFGSNASVFPPYVTFDIAAL